MSLPALSEWLHVALTELCFGELVRTLLLSTRACPCEDFTHLK